MPKTEHVTGSKENSHSLRVKRYPASKKKSPRIRVKCGCCKETLVICPEDASSGNPDADLLEIGGVMAAVDQWRKILLPLLSIETRFRVYREDSNQTLKNVGDKRRMWRRGCDGTHHARQMQMFELVDDDGEIYTSLVGSPLIEFVGKCDGTCTDHDLGYFLYKVVY